MGDPAGFQVDVLTTVMGAVSVAQVDHEVRETPHGQGVFLLHPVARGQLVWRWAWDGGLGDWCTRYREGVNVLVYPGEEETVAHLASLGCDGDRYGGLCWRGSITGPGGGSWSTAIMTVESSTISWTMANW